MKIQNHGKLLRCPVAVAICACCAGLTGMAQSVPYGNTGAIIPNSSAEQVYASGGDVTVTYYHGVEGDQDILYLNGTEIFDNWVNSPGDTVDLGTIAAGTLLNFTMEDVNYGNTWHIGSGVNNSDGNVHAYVVDNYPISGTTYVAFEDETTGEEYVDWNYNDIAFTFTSTSPAPEPSTLALAGLSGLGLLLFRRRK